MESDETNHDSESIEKFKNKVEKFVYKYSKRILTKDIDYAQVGKAEIHKSRKKIVNRIIAGDGGRHRYDAKALDKIKQFVKNTLLKQFG